MSATDIHHDNSHPTSTRRGYLIGFLLSAVLTAIPFWLVMTHVIADPQVAVIAVVGLAFVQIIVHTVFFLHVNTRSEGGWTLLTLMFTAVIITIVVSGSLWIMYHLNSNMMPMTPGKMPGM